MRLDIVIPAHNEEARIGRSLAAYRDACADHDVRFLVAMDDCRDRTAQVVAAHRDDDARVECVAYPKLGKGGVIAESFRRADADLVAFVDADGAIASRRHPAAVLPARRPLTRLVTSAGFSFAVRRLMGLPYADTQCGAKVLRREVVDAVL